MFCENQMELICFSWTRANRSRALVQKVITSSECPAERNDLLGRGSSLLILSHDIRIRFVNTTYHRWMERCPTFSYPDNHLLRYFQLSWSGQQFQQSNQIQEFRELFKSKLESFFYDGIHYLAERCLYIIENKGEYYHVPKVIIYFTSMKSIKTEI